MKQVLGSYQRRPVWCESRAGGAAWMASAVGCYRIKKMLTIGGFQVHRSRTSAKDIQSTRCTARAGISNTNSWEVVGLKCCKHSTTISAVVWFRVYP